MIQTEIWTKYDKRLKMLKKGESSRIFELAFCRDFSREIHGFKSKLMAERDKGGLDEAKNLAKIQEKLVQLIEQFQVPSDFPNGFEILLDVEKPFPKRDDSIEEIKLDEFIFDYIPRKKLERPDRKWEKAIISEAIKHQWSFWTMDCWIKIYEAEKFNSELAMHMFPKGVTLFVEGSDEFHMDTAETGSSDVVWPGKWTLVCEKGAEPQSFEIESVPGYFEGKDKIIWKNIYESK